MRIAACLIIFLVLAATASGAEQTLSETRTANCIVRVVVDPSIIPLNPQTANHLVLSSGVAGKATREVLTLDADAALHVYEGIEIEWLAQSIRPIGQEPMPGKPGGGGGQMPRSPGQSRNEGYDVMGQLAEIYGDQYTQYMEKQPDSQDSATKKDNRQTDEPASGGRRDRSSQTGGRPGRGTGRRSDDSAMMMGGMGGGMGGGVMSGGMGGGMGGGMMGGGMMGGGMMGGGMGGGMMSGGMGGYGYGYGGMGGVYGGPPQGAQAGRVEHSATLRLSVHLPDDVKPAAAEFLEALVENLRQAVRNAFEKHEEELSTLVAFAESRREGAENNLDMAMGIRSPDRMRIQEQLDTIVDLSMLSPEMPFSEAIENLKYAVEPPLPIIVLWRELLDSCEIEPTTSIDMDGLPSVKLETALRTLLEAVGGGFADLSYQIDNDVIIIREEELPTPPSMPSGPGMETDIRDLAAFRRDLARDVQRLEMNLATGQARRQAIEQQIAEVRDEASKRLGEDAVTRELEKLIEMNAHSLSLIQKQFEAGRISESELAQARESLAKARIDLAIRREEISRSVGGNRLSQLNLELSQMAIDVAERRTELEITRQQLGQTEAQLAQASMFDPKARRTRIAQEALDIAEARVIRLRTQLAYLQPPTVTVIGAN